MCGARYGEPQSKIAQSVAARKIFCTDTIVFDSIPSKKFAQSLPDSGLEGSMTARRQRCQTPAKE
jgi:hypothetical protein